MCGRYTIVAGEEAVRDAFDLRDIPFAWRPRYNVAPTQRAPVVALGDGGPAIAELRWGLVPSWARDASVGNRMINARAETAAVKPAFRAAFKRRRCLVVADGFYEWRRGPDGKIPMRITRRDSAPMAFAGLWERWAPEDQPHLDTFTILTMAAGPLVRPIHDRMPVIVPPDSRARWLDPDTDAAAALDDLMARDEGAELTAYEVSKLVNAPANDVPACLEPVA
ncbi:MAG: SOS response-associated peptidase [Gemmatimonadota bacterium]